MVVHCYPTLTSNFVDFSREEYRSARLNPRQIREGPLCPVRDGSVDRVFHGRAEYIPVMEPTAIVPILAANPIPIVEKESDTTMVVWKRMTSNHFLPRGRSAPQQQPPPLAPRGRKRPQDTLESTQHPSDAPPSHSSVPTAIPLVIRETPSNMRPIELMGSN